MSDRMPVGRIERLTTQGAGTGPVALSAFSLATIARMRLERDEAVEQRDRARALACRLEEELALIRRAGQTRRLG